MTPRAGFLLDANVLIDFVEVEVELLGIVARNLAPVHVLTAVLQESNQFDESECAALGIRILESDYRSAGEETEGRLSLTDRLCLRTCSVQGLTCVTNDKALRRACVRADVRVKWGLELLLELVEARHIGSLQASSAARRMHSGNPLFLDAAVLAAFHRRLDSIGRFYR